MTRLGPGATKAAYDAMTDQSLAAVREQRHSASPDLLSLSGDVAQIIAEQFSNDKRVAGRVVMAVSQIILGLKDKPLDHLSFAETTDLLTGMLIFAAEQVVREGGD